MFLEKRKYKVNFVLSSFLDACYDVKSRQTTTIYLQIVADFQRDFGQGDSHSPVLRLADPGVHLLSGEEFLQTFQRLQMVWHDEDHGGLLLAQWHVQHKDTVLSVLVEVIQTCDQQVDKTNVIMSAFLLSVLWVFKT